MLAKGATDDKDQFIAHIEHRWCWWRGEATLPLRYNCLIISVIWTTLYHLPIIFLPLWFYSELLFIRIIFVLSCSTGVVSTLFNYIIESTWKFGTMSSVTIMVANAVGSDPESLQWRHNERNGASTHRRLDCLLNRLFKRRPNKTSTLCVTGLCEENPPVTGGFPSQRASIAENVSHLMTSSWMTQRSHQVIRSYGSAWLD